MSLRLTINAAAASAAADGLTKQSIPVALLPGCVSLTVAVVWPCVCECVAVGDSVLRGRTDGMLPQTTSEES